MLVWYEEGEGGERVPSCSGLLEKRNNDWELTRDGNDDDGARGLKILPCGTRLWWVDRWLTNRRHMR